MKIFKKLKAMFSFKRKPRCIMIAGNTFYSRIAPQVNLVGDVYKLRNDTKFRFYFDYGSMSHGLNFAFDLKRDAIEAREKLIEFIAMWEK